MPHPKLIIYEKTGAVATAMRSRLDAVQQRLLIETRSLTQLEEALDEADLSLAVMEATAENVGSVVSFIDSAQQTHDGCRFVVVADSELRSWEPLLRHAGAVHLVFSVAYFESIAQLAKKFSNVQTGEPRDIREEFLSRIPWN